MTADEIRHMLCNIALDTMERYGDNKTAIYRDLGIEPHLTLCMMEGKSVSIYKVARALEALGYDMEIKKR